MKYYISSTCHQCENPECIRFCAQKAYRKRHDGIVILDSSKCTNCGTCIHACPFEAPVRDPVTGHTTKCDYCYSRLDKGANPYCVDACPVKALQLREFDLGVKEIDTTIVKALPGAPRIQLTHPSIKYRSLNVGKQVFRFQILKR